MIFVRCLEDGTLYGFSAKTPYDAMTKMVYTLNVANEDDSAVINKTITGKHLWVEHGGKTYAILANK